MSEHPRLYALLGELLGLDTAELQLPLPVLINLHRPHLRAPLENLARVAGDAWVEHDDHLQHAFAIVLEHVDVCWPMLAGGELWRRSDLDALTRITDMYHPEERIVWWEPKTEHEQVVLYLIQEAFQDWCSYDPLYVLHHLSTAEGATRDALCELLEIELGIDPATRELILAHANKA